MRFQAIFFDLFNTLLYFDYSYLSRVQYQGRTLPSTSPKVFEAVSKEADLDVSFDEFLVHFFDAQSQMSEKKLHHREYHSRDRFLLLSRALGLEDELADLMVRTHMGEMFQMIYRPDVTESILSQAREFPLVLASNFDHSPTALRALADFEIREYFDSIFISVDLGWRKPGQEFFEMILERTGFSAKECLFVGDDPVADVVGASGVGFQVAWLSHKRGHSPPVEPTWTLDSLEDVSTLLSEG